MATETGLTGRARIRAALSPQGADEFAAVICYEGIFVRDHWEQVTDCPWWYAISPELEQQLAWRRDYLQRSGCDWFVVPLCPPRAQREAQSIEVRGDGAHLVDAAAGTRRRLARPRIAGWTAVGASESVHPAHPPQTPEEVDAALPLPAAFDPAALRRSGACDLADALRAAFPERYPIHHVAGPLWRAYSLWGYEGLMARVAAQPELVRHACERELARQLAAVRVAAALGAEGIWIEDCLTDQVSPRAFRALNVPYLQALVQEIRALGMASIYYYCGNPADRWDELLAVGADALSLEESKKGFVVDMAEVAARVGGRCALLGNLDAIELLRCGSDDEMRAELARQAAAGRRNGGRFVYSLGSPVTPETPLARVRRYVDLARGAG